MVGCALAKQNDNDQKFIQLAIAGQADILVTGDADLLVLQDQTPFEIITPAKYRSRYE